MRRLRVESTTDSELHQAYAELLQPSNINAVTVTVASAPQVRADGAIEHVEPTTEVDSAFVRGDELRQNMMTYTRGLDQYKTNHPQFAQYADPNTQLPIAVRDEILRMENGPEIVEFLAFSPDVCAQLCLLDPVEAARKVAQMSEDLDWGRVPEENLSYEDWRDERNRAESARRHTPRKR